MARSLLAAEIVGGGRASRLFKLILGCSLPHVAWGEEVAGQVVSAAHRAAWDTAHEAAGGWIHAFMAERSLPKKLGILLKQCKDHDEGSQAIAQFIASDPKDRVAAFAFAIYAAAVTGKLPIGTEGINDLGRIASPILSVDGEITWHERLSASDTRHPELDRFVQVTNKLKLGRRERAEQFFNWCLVADVKPEDPVAIEKEINDCVKLLARRGLA